MCVCACLSVCLSVCLSMFVTMPVCPDDLITKDWCHTNNILQTHSWRCLGSCASYVSHTHEVIDDVICSQSRSYYKIAISTSIFQLERRSKAQNIGNAHGYLTDIFNIWYYFRQKSLSPPQNGGHFENFEILNTASIYPQICKDCPKLCHKKYFSW